MVSTAAKDHGDKVLKINSSVFDCSKASIKALSYTFGVGLRCPHLQAGPGALVWRGAGVCDPLCPPRMKHCLSVAPAPKLLCSLLCPDWGKGERADCSHFMEVVNGKSPQGLGVEGHLRVLLCSDGLGGAF